MNETEHTELNSQAETGDIVHSSDRTKEIQSETEHTQKKPNRKLQQGNEREFESQTTGFS